MENLIEVNFMTERFLVDSNILVYLIDTADELKHEKALEWLSNSYSLSIFVSTQNIREFANNCLKKSASNNQILEFIELFCARFIVLQDDQLDTKNAIELSKGNRNLFWGASLVSVMKRNNINLVFTENVKDFQKLGVKAINPSKQ
ncbi:MAG: PIN domain protein [archaeon ADurb.Bin336]|nr:MAG: PIN domain protein [archaeon ADurb.Bin336]